MLQLLLAASAHESSSPSPSVLFASPAFGTSDVWISLDYLKGLHNDSDAPLHVDYTSSLTQLNRSRIFQYNAVVLFHSVMAPGGKGLLLRYWRLVHGRI